MASLRAFQLHDNIHPEETGLNFWIFILFHADDLSTQDSGIKWQLPMSRGEKNSCHALCCSSMMFSKLGY